MTWARLCEHGEVKGHWLFPNSWLTCPGGSVLPDDTLVAIWWCVTHESRANPVLDGEHEKGLDLEMWGGCHDSLWSFASGVANGGNEAKVGRCSIVKKYLLDALAAAQGSQERLLNLALALLRVAPPPLEGLTGNCHSLLKRSQQPGHPLPQGSQE